MKVIIAGSRTITDYKEVELAIKESGFDITEIISGCAKGVDTLGEIFAINNNIKLTKFPAYWEKYGKAAGFIRNAEMAKYGEMLIAIYVGESKGTLNMIKQMKKMKKPIYSKKL